MTFRPPLDDILFALDRMAGADALAATTRFAETAAPEARDAALAEAARLCADVLGPVNAVGDRQGARLENGVVRCPDGFAEAYAAVRDGGWIGVAADPAHGGMGLPQSTAVAIQEMMAGANLAFANVVLLTNGQIDALEAHAPDWVKALYLPKLIAGDWTGAMNLTEPQAGTDLAALRCRAEPAGDGTHRLRGQKIYITWGDHELAENVSHLVLARLPDAPAGVRGVSLFLAPKFLPDAGGRPGARNALRPVSLERKLGIHASPTCVMEYDGATAWMIGEPGGGLPAMFTMMNAARINVAAQGVGVAAAALALAEAYAASRVQGRTPFGAPTIEGHADVRRMLATMRARTAAARGICYLCAVAIDRARAGGADAAVWQARAAFLTPIAKAFCTDVGVEVASLGLQVHGGMGYVEDAGAAQLLRDARITPIYEGANGVQAMDLVGRKLADGGAAARGLLDGIAEAPAPLRAAKAALTRATDWMLAAGAVDRQAGAADYLRAWALTLGAHLLVRGAAADPARAPLADFFLRRELPLAHGHLAAATDGAAALYPERAAS
jgi:alkylation response protein AidB-like acyl-CoA dehydrogenase